MDREPISYVNGIPLPTSNTRRNIVVATLLFTWSLITLIVFFGSSDNSLHTSALAWSFALSGSTIFAYVFGAVVDNWNTVRAINQPAFDEWYRNRKPSSSSK